MQGAEHLVSYPQKHRFSSGVLFEHMFRPPYGHCALESIGKQRFVHFCWKRLVWGMARNSVDRVVA